MRIVALSLLVLSSNTFAGDQAAASKTAKPTADTAAAADPAADTTTAKPVAKVVKEAAQDNSLSSVAKSMTLEAAIAYELSYAKPFGLTIYKGKNFLLPGLTELGLNSKIPDPIMPGQDETVPESMPPVDNANGTAAAKETEAK